MDEIKAYKRHCELFPNRHCTEYQFHIRVKTKWLTRKSISTCRYIPPLNKINPDVIRYKNNWKIWDVWLENYKYKLSKWYTKQESLKRIHRRKNR